MNNQERKSEVVVVKQSCHSRGISGPQGSGIYHACRCSKKENTLLNVCVEDPRCRHSGMTPNFNQEEALNKNAFRAPLRSGFTLIELLVVVLIIGILAAVALPQYQKAVEKTRLTEAIQNISALERATEVALLSMEPGEITKDKLDIVLEDKNGFSYLVQGSDTEQIRCHAGVKSIVAVSSSGTRFVLVAERDKNGKWYRNWCPSGMNNYQLGQKIMPSLGLPATPGLCC